MNIRRLRLLLLQQALVLESGPVLFSDPGFIYQTRIRENTLGMMDTFTELFERRKKLSVFWYNKSSDLRASAGVLWASINDSEQATAAEKLGFPPSFSFSIACRPVYHMLCGMSLELLLKAVLVDRGIEPKATHNLVDLSQAAAIALTNTQTGLFRILSDASIWEGRYPVPKQERYLRDLSELHTEHLWEPVPEITGIKLRRPNNSLGWESFNELWLLIFSAYEHHP